MKLTRKNMIATGVFVAVCAVIGTLFYLQFMTTNEETKFNQVLADMQELKTDLQSNVSSVNWQLQKSCNQGHEAYTKGAIACTIGVAFQTQVSDTAAMRAIATAFNSTVRNHSAAFTQQTHKITDSSLDFITLGQPNSVGDTYKHGKTGMQCSSYIGITQEKPYVFAILFQCTSQAQRKYFSNPVVS